MIPVLRSIDGLLNRFDELSQRHSSFISNFDSNFSNIENPLRDVARNEDEQRKTAENLSRATTGNDDQMGSSATLDEFNRRIIKSRSYNRPPSYCSNDSSSLLHRIPSRTSWATTESAPPPRTSTYAMTPTAIKGNISRPVGSTSLDNLIDIKDKLITKIKPKILPQSPPNIRRPARSAITTFTMETVNRLSKPKTYHQSPNQRSSPKRVHRRTKPYQNMNKERSTSSSPSPQIKRTIPTTIKSSPKKLKVDNKISSENSKKIPMSNYPRPVVFLAPPPTICLTFPMQPELQSSRVVVIPKTTATTTVKKTTGIFTNKRSMTFPNRLMYLIT